MTDATPHRAADKTGYEIALRLIEKNIQVALGLLQSAANEASLFDSELEHELDNCDDRVKRAYPAWQGAFMRVDRTAT